METEIKNIEAEAISKIESCESLESLLNVKAKYLGKQGALSAILKKLSSIPEESRKQIGKLANEVKRNLEEQISKVQNEINEAKLEKNLKNEEIDVTLPGKKIKRGKLHPLTKVLNRIEDIFISLGFAIVDGDEIETNYYNFDALNIDENHPARDSSDTFYLGDELILRTQTSPVQVHVMEKNKPPIKIISLGKVYRFDEIDATHAPMFHQIEGLVVDRNISMANLKATLETFIEMLYGKKVKTRFRPHHFPFTEPSAEMDIECFSCNGEGCNICKGEGFIEILGCGMVHKNVLENCKIDSRVYSGYAFGLGLERIVMRNFEIGDLRWFFENNVKFLNQF